MFQAISDWLHKLSHAGETEAQFPAADPRLSLAALLVHIVTVDGVVTDDEKSRLREVLRTHYALSDNETEALVEEATRHDENAVDLYGFTSVLKRELSEEERLEVIALMWELVFADGVLNELEDNVVWRVAELLGVSARDRVTIRQRVEQQRAGR